MFKILDWVPVSSCDEYFNYGLEEINTPVDADKLHQLLVLSCFDKQKTKILVDGFRNGFDIGYRGPYFRESRSENIPITVGTHLELWNKIMKEVKLGRVAGPYDQIPEQFQKSFMQSPVGLVPKAGNQTRLIFHLSYDFGSSDCEKSLNFHTPDEICKVKYNDLDSAIRTSLRVKQDWQKSIRGTKHSEQGLQPLVLHYGKSDLRAAFRLLPVLPEQRRFLLFKARHPITGKFAFFAEKNLPFGASVSCARFQLFSDCLRHIMEHASGRFNITNYLDDFLFVGETELICNRMVRQFLTLCSFLGCEVAPEKTEWAAPRVIFLGIMLNGDTCTLSLPVQKSNKALELLNWAISKRKVTIKFIQRLTGTLNFLNKAVVPGRAFTRGMYAKLKVTNNKGDKLKQYHHVSLGKEFLSDCEIWKEFLTNSTCVARNCRPYVDVNLYEEATNLDFYTDASLNGKLGCGGVFKNRWFILTWPSGFVENYHPSIAYLELYALVMGVLIWGQDAKLSNTRLAIYCDNESVKFMVNSFASNCHQCRKLLRLLALDGMRNNRWVFVRHVRTEKNNLADALSRNQLNRFWREAPPGMNTRSNALSKRIWPIQKVWNDNDCQIN